MKSYAQMTTTELAQATKLYEGCVIDKTRPLNAKEHDLWERAKRGRGLPKNRKGAKV
jgi:hypothetical protein